MPLSGEAIRMMNYVDDISVTLRRILTVLPSLTDEERQHVASLAEAKLRECDPKSVGEKMISSAGHGPFDIYSLTLTYKQLPICFYYYASCAREIRSGFLVRVIAMDADQEFIGSLDTRLKKVIRTFDALKLWLNEEYR